MKKILVVAALMLIATWSFAADFNPNVMTLTGESEIVYDFDGTELTIPFDITGTPAAVYFVLNTHGQAASIGAVQNGHLGWHYVNGIDTTVYVSQRYSRDVGSSTIVWDGKDADGNNVSPGTYDYYLWAYDDQTARQLLCDYMMIGYDWESQFTKIYTKGSDGLPLTRPIVCGSQVWWWSDDAIPHKNHGTHLKWEVGGDPTDLELLQTTWCAMYQNRGYVATYSYGGPVFNPTDYNIFYHCSTSTEQNTNTFLKWEFVTDGEAILDETWLGWDELVLEDRGMAIGVWSQKPSCYTDGDYIYAVSPGLHQKEEEWNKLRCVSFDGELIFDKMLHEWYMPDDNGPNEYVNGAFHHMHFDPTRTNHWLIGSHTSCMHEMIDTTLILEDADTDAEDYIVWKNANGDYFLDMAYQPDFEPAWICLHDEQTWVSRRDSFSVDKNGINFIAVSYLGLTSFGVSTQDGTAIDMCSYADDTVSDNRIIKGGGLVCSGGTGYDGIYTSGPLTSGASGWIEISQIWYTASDSFHGTITYEPLVGILGDVNNTSTVNVTDALIVASYDLDHTITIPDNGDIRLGDVNKDNLVKITDALIIATYDIDSSNPNLPTGIGQSVGAGKLVAESRDDEQVYSEVTIPVRLDLPDSDLEMGKNISVAVNIDLTSVEEKLGAYSAILSWDTEMLSYDGYTGGITEGFDHPLAMFVGGKLRFNQFSTEGAGGNVNIINVSFLIKDEIAGNPLSIDFSSLSTAYTFHDLLPYVQVIDYQDISSILSTSLPETISLSQNYPNPFNAETTITYNLPVGGKVNLSVYNINGQRVRTLVDVERAAGSYSVMWDGKNDEGHDVASGFYLYRLKTNSYVRIKRMVFIR